MNHITESPLLCPKCGMKVYVYEGWCGWCGEYLEKYNESGCCPKCGIPDDIAKAITDYIKSERLT